MRTLLFSGLIALAAAANAAPPAPSASYDISVQTESGIDTQQRELPSDGQVHTWSIAGATVEITTPSDTSPVVELKLYSDATRRELLHTARIGGAALPVRVAYSLCDGRVTYMSPPPTLPGPCTKQPGP